MPAAKKSPCSYKIVLFFSQKCSAGLTKAPYFITYHGTALALSNLY